MIVPPGLSRPARSAASIIGRPIRSLTEPPGLSISSFASRSGWRSAGPRSRVSREMRTRGVSPTRSRIDSAYCIGREDTVPPARGQARPAPASGLRRGRAGRVGAAARSAARGAAADARAGRRRRVRAPRPPDRAPPRSAPSAGGRASSSSRDPARAGGVPSRRRRAARAAVVGGRMREAMRRPTYSSSVPAIASGTIGAPVRSAISAAPRRNGADPPGRPADRRPRESGRTRPPLRITARADATCCSTPIPPRHTGSSPPTRWMSHSRQREVKVDGPLPEEPAPRLHRAARA